MNHRFRFHIRLRGVAVEGTGLAVGDTPEEAEVNLRTALGSARDSGVLQVELAEPMADATGFPT
jgi:hypothetical protein